jgi:arylsulfatase
MDTYEGGIATPLIAHWPKGIAGARFARQPGHIMDIMPTLLDVAGAEYPSHVEGRAILPTEGRSLAARFRGDEGEDHEALFWEHQGNRAVRQGRWKLLAANKGPWELYDLEADRTELNDLAAEFPERVRTMRTLYEDWAARCGVQPWPVKKREQGG